MVHLYKRALIICLVAFTCIFSCTKKDSTTSYDVSHLNEYFAGLRTTPQNITVQAGRDTVVSGASGTLIHFYPYSFKDAAGNTIRSGNISIKLVEMYKPGEMIANRTSATADNMPLQSGGQVNIVATLNGNDVVANVFGIGFKQGGNSGQQMELYYKSGNNPDSSITWKMTDTTKPGRVSRSATSTDSSIYSNNAGIIKKYSFPGFRYLFDSCTSFGWINCDHPATGKWGSGANYTVVRVILEDKSFNESNTQVFFVFPSINCAEQLTFYDKPTNSFGGYDPKPSFPIGEPYKMVVTSFKEDGFYYAEKSGTITENMNITVTPASETLFDIKARLGGI